MLDKIKVKAGQHFPKSKRNSRIIKTVLCFAVAIALTASIFVAAQSQREVTYVVKTVKDLQPGTMIKETDLKLEEVGEYGLPSNALTSKEDVVGKYVKPDTTIYTTDYITTDKLTNKTAEPFVTLKTNKEIMSFSVANLAASVANNIKKGDTIQVIYSEQTADPSGMNVGYTVVASDYLKELTVIDIKDSNGAVQESSRSDVSNLYTSTEFVPAVITVEIDSQQAVELYKAELSKSIHVVFKERGKELQ